MVEQRGGTHVEQTSLFCRIVTWWHKDIVGCRTKSQTHVLQDKQILGCGTAGYMHSGTDMLCFV